MRLGMANRHGCVAIQQQHCHGLADNIAASDHYRLRSCDFDFAALEHLHDARRSAWNEARSLRGKEPDVGGMKAVHVFRGINRQQNFLGIDLRGKRQLHQDAVNFIAPV